MAPYNIRFKETVRKDLKKIPKKDVLSILAKIESLAANPIPVQAELLSGDDKYRIRQGMYRILLYQIEEDILTVCIVKVGHRRDVYRK